MVVTAIVWGYFLHKLTEFSEKGHIAGTAGDVHLTVSQ